MSKKLDIRPLTGVRGILAIWVVIFHVFLFLTLALGIKIEEHFGEFTSNIFWRGYFAVDIFFLLSGFVISYSYSDRFKKITLKSYFSYIYSRFFRIYPVHIFVLLIFALFYWVINLPLPDRCFPYDPDFDCNKYDVSSFIKNLFLIQSWDWFPLNSWNVVAWSISSEFFAYIIFPFLLIFLNHFNKIWVSVFIIFALISAMLAITYSSNSVNHYYTLFSELVLAKNSSEFTKDFLNSPNQIAFEFGLIRIFFEFLVGCFIYKIFDQLKGIKLKYSNACFILILLLITLSFNYGNMLLHYYLAPFLILLMAIDDKSYFSKFLSMNFINWLGKISYSTYMIQVVILSLLAKPIISILNSGKFYDTVSVYLVTILVIAVTLISGALLYYFVENPVQRLSKNKVR